MRQWFLFSRHRTWNFLWKALFRDKLQLKEDVEVKAKVAITSTKWKAEWKSSWRFPGTPRRRLSCTRDETEIYICSWLRRDRKASRSRPPCRGTLFWPHIWIEAQMLRPSLSRQVQVKAKSTLVPTLALGTWAAQSPSLQLSQMFRFVFSLIHYFYSFNIRGNWKQKSVSPWARCLPHLGQTQGAVGFLAGMNITSVLKELLMPRASAESEVSWLLPESRDQTPPPPPFPPPGHKKKREK